jgi:hypothetical protein
LTFLFPSPRSAVLPNRALILALLANACYCAAYVVDIRMQSLFVGDARRRYRWLLWLIGTLFAVVFENYRIADEIYPYVHE